MDRRAFFAAAGGLLATTAMARGQTVVGGALDGANDIVGAGLAAPGQILGGLGAGLGDVGGLGGGIGNFGLADLMGGEYSIETSNLALERSRNRAVRQFAQLEIAEQLSIASALGAAPGSVRPRPDQQAKVAKLANTRPASFDHAYVMGQIMGHEELLSINNQAVHSAADPAIRRVATVSIPTIETHLAILHRLRAGIPAV